MNYHKFLLQTDLSRQGLTPPFELLGVITKVSGSTSTIHTDQNQPIEWPMQNLIDFGIINYLQSLFPDLLIIDANGRTVEIWPTASHNFTAEQLNRLNKHLWPLVEPDYEYPYDPNDFYYNVGGEHYKITLRQIFDQYWYSST